MLSKISEDVDNYGTTQEDLNAFGEFDMEDLVYEKTQGIGKFHQSGYADCREAVEAAFGIIVGSRSGQRSRQVWTRFTIYECNVVRSAVMSVPDYGFPERPAKGD
jgi:hypothetical protein